MRAENGQDSNGKPELEVCKISRNSSNHYVSIINSSYCPPKWSTGAPYAFEPDSNPRVARSFTFNFLSTRGSISITLHYNINHFSTFSNPSRSRGEHTSNLNNPTMLIKPSKVVAILALIAIIHDVDAFSAQASDRPPSTSNAQQQQPFSKPTPLPITDNPHTLLGFDWLSPPKDFTLIHRAYRNLARKYHPDIAVGPDATSEERTAASLEFTRISEAYEDLKSRQDEEEIEVVIMGGNFSQGKTTRRVKYKTSEKIRLKNPNRVNYDRIAELRDRKNLKGTNWSDPGEFEYQQGGRHNGDFGPPRRW